MDKHAIRGHALRAISDALVKATAEHAKALIKKRSAPKDDEAAEGKQPKSEESGEGEC